MKNYIFTIVAVFISLGCISQTTGTNNTDTLNLQKIIFHSSPCNGTCPNINLEIDSNRNISLNREVYKTKSGLDKNLSGQFKGTVNTEDYSNLKSLLQSCQIGTISFPAINCCDAPVITIIVYYNNKKAYLKSMVPPQAAGKLISFLTRIGTAGSLEKTNGVMSIEE